MARHLVLAALLFAGLSGSARAENRIDVSRLPIDIKRIARALEQSVVREERDGLNLRYYVNIYGQAPPIEIFTPEDNLRTGPVPFTAPTHQEFLDHITPREFRTPVMDINAVMHWLGEQLSRRTGERRR